MSTTTRLTFLVAMVWGCVGSSASSARAGCDLNVPPLEIAVPNNVTELLVNPSDYPSAAEFRTQELAPRAVVERLLQSRYAIISAGPNAALGEKPYADRAAFYDQRHHQLRREIEKAQYRDQDSGRELVGYFTEVQTKRKRPLFDKIEEVEGRYGQVEKSLFIHFTPAQSLADLELERQWLIEMGAKFQQDSVVYSAHGLQFLIHTTEALDEHGQVKNEKVGSMYVGIGMQVFKDQPLDNYTRFETSQGNYYFSLNFNFERLWNSWDEWQAHFRTANAKRYTSFVIFVHET